MSSQIIPVEPFDYIVFGGTGDLAERKLLPALYHRQKDGQLTEPTRIVGASRAQLSNEDYRKGVSRNRCRGDARCLRVDIQGHPRSRPGT